MITHNLQRVVAIVGRPNVGKSSLFNRLAGTSVAIVHEERGVTRDRLIRDIQWKGQPATLMDTGGLETVEASHHPSQDGLRQIRLGVQRQVETAIAEAAVILFMVDIETGLTPQDEDIAILLRKYGAPVFVAANKADNTARDIQTAEFERLGFPVFPISALHFRGVEALMDDVLACLPDAEPPTLETALKVTIVGRPNVGKSSFINRLLQSERLIVSEMPGTTRDSIDIPFTIGSGPDIRRYLLTDTAGLRRPGRTSGKVDWLSLRKTEKSIARSDIVILMLDATQGPTAQDKKIAAFIEERQRGCLIAVNKWDLMKDYEMDDYLKALRKAVPFLDYVPVTFVSSVSGLNIRRTIEVIESVAERLRTRLPTGPLNRALSDAYGKIQPPLVSGRRLKIFYATQVGNQPLRIVLFVNDPRRLLPAYRGYLIKTLRKTFALDGVPVILAPRERSQKTEHGKDEGKD